MSEEEIVKLIQSLRLRPGIEAVTDDLLKDFINDSIQDVKDYINYSDEEELPLGCISIVKELVIIKCNRLGAEGLSGQSSSGISENYNDDIPKPLKKKLYRYRKLRW